MKTLSRRRYWGRAGGRKEEGQGQEGGRAGAGRRKALIAVEGLAAGEGEEGRVGRYSRGAVEVRQGYSAVLGVDREQVCW